MRWFPPLAPITPPNQKDTNKVAGAWLAELSAAAVDVVGQKTVSDRTKPWVSRDLAALFRIRDASRSIAELANFCNEDSITTAARDTCTLTKRMIRSISKSNRLASHLKDLRSIEVAPHGSKIFWTRWKARLRALNAGSTPDCAVDPDGKLVSEPLEVLSVWKNYVSELGKEAPISVDPGDRATNIDESDFDDAFADRILAALRSDLAGGVAELDAPITWLEIHAAVRGLMGSKAAGLDGVVPELLINGGIASELALTKLFNFLWTNLVWPDEWRRAILIPLFKGDGSKQDPSNHRMLAMMSVVAKLFEKVLDSRLRAWGERVGMLSDLQGGFREGRGTLDQMFILNEIVAKRWLEERRPVFLTFIDVRKAYDRVWRPGLWFKLRQAGVGGRMLAMLKEMYKRVSRSVLVNGNPTEDFVVEAALCGLYQRLA